MPTADTKIAMRLATTTGRPTKLKIQIMLKRPVTLDTSLGMRPCGLIASIHVAAADTTTTARTR
jgi:sulfite exporter TauE/SafE